MSIAFTAWFHAWALELSGLNSEVMIVVGMSGVNISIRVSAG